MARVTRVPRRKTLIFDIYRVVNAGRWSPRAAPLYLVTITLGCMKCATGIQPSPHNSPIYDWAKLLSMRRIKSRARVQEKSAGRRDGRPRAAAAALRGRGARVSPFPPSVREENAARVAARRTLTTTTTRPRPRADPRRLLVFPAIFLRVSRAADKLAVKLNARSAAAARIRGAATAFRLDQSPSAL